MGLNELLTKFGICERCGRTGNEIDSDTGVSTPGTGYELFYYEGQWLDRLCIIELKDLEHSKVATELESEEQKERGLAGFTET